MKIITLEEHTGNQEIVDASKKQQREAAPWNDHFSLPYLSSAKANSLLTDVAEGRIADMDANGIDMQILSISNATHLVPASEAPAIALRANNKMAQAVKAYPTRFGAFATLPLSEPEAAAKELERTVTELGFQGAMINGRPSAGAIFLDDPFYAPVLEAANKLKVPIYMHPGLPYKDVYNAYYSRLDPVVSARFATYGWGWHSEAGIQLIHMILSGTFDKYPDLRLIAGHWGEMVPFYLSRLDDSLPRATTHLLKEISAYFREHIYVTPSGMFTLPHFLFTLEIMGEDRILYSIDYPYVGEEGARQFLENAPVSQDVKEKIAYKNAEKLLKL